MADSSSSQYDQESKKEARSKLIEHAVRCLTTERSTSVCVKRDDVARVWKQLHESGKAGEYFTEKERQEIEEEIVYWEHFHDSQVQTRRPSDLRVCYLCGENPIDDLEVLEVLVTNGVLCQNVWAVEKDSKKLEKGWNAIKNPTLRKVKLFDGGFLTFLKDFPGQFDIIYFDACGCLPAAKENTLKVIGYVFLYNKLTSPGALITNFSFPPQDTRQENPAISQDVYLDKEREMINVLVKEYMNYRLCNVLGKENNAEYLSERTDDHEDNYGDYVSFQVIDSAYLFIPAQRILWSKRKLLLGQIFNFSSEVESTTEGTNERSTKTTRNQELMASLEELNEKYDRFLHQRKMAGIDLEKSNSYCEAFVAEIFPDLKSLPREGNSSVPSTPLPFSSPHYIIQFCKDLSKCLVPLLKADVDERILSCCDMATPEQIICHLADLLYGQMAYPSFPVRDKLFRLRYTYEQRQMFGDVFVFDKCRYLFDQFLSVDCAGFAERKQQILFTVVVDGLCKHLGGICSEDLFKFCNVGQGYAVITEGGAIFPNSVGRIPERQKIEDILFKKVKKIQEEEISYSFAATESRWVVTSADKLRYDAIFKQADKDGDGLVSGEDVKSTFMASVLDEQILAHIWELCDITNQGQLNSEEFALAMYLIDQKDMGVDPPQMLSPEMVPPSKRASSAGGPVAAGEVTSSLPRCISMDSERPGEDRQDDELPPQDTRTQQEVDQYVGLHTDFVQARIDSLAARRMLGNEEDSDEMIRMERATPLFSEEVALDQATGMIGTATVADDEEVLKEDTDQMARIATFGEKVNDDIPDLTFCALDYPMASSSPSPLASSVENTNGAKLSRLLIDGGKMVLRKIFDRYHPPANLQANLNANYGTLNNLLRRKVLHRPQWDLLFPPDGAIPDSNTFDITLLFLLLKSICGLSPPPSWWHTKPSASDTSFEANLARIKFFRNELYGHVITTGTDTPTFSALWQEISAVLVALGLPQAEIDRLKAEHCGEEDFLDVLFEWADSEEDIKSQLRDMCQDQVQTGQTVVEVRQTQIEDQKTMQDIKEMVEDALNLQSVDVEVQREKNRENEILKKLAKIETLKNVRNHADRYVDGTRLSFFSAVDSWLNDRSCPNRVMVISGSAGMGKSVISAVICEKMQDAGRLAGSHFCQHDRARHRNPKVMLQSLASQLCDILPEYKKALMEKLSRNLGVEINNMEVKDLFKVLFEEPLASLNDSSLAYLMVIDGLDESEFQGRNELLDVIANYFQGLPLWIRFLVTTRPEINIAENLKNLQPLQLDPNVEENVKDILLFFDKQIGHLLQSEHQEIFLRALVQKSEGVMLYAHYLADFIKKEMPVLTPELLDSILPSGISSVYRKYFKRLETELCTELSVMEDRFFTFLSAVAASREPLPLGFVSKLLLPGKSTSAAQRKINAAISCVSALLPVQDGCIHFFHKSVKDWLIDKSNYGQHHFSVDEKEGHEVLSKLCIDELHELKRKGVDGAQFSDITKYALRHGVQHMLHLEDARECSLEEVVAKFVLDVELVYAKLCVNVTAAFEDIICVQRQEGIEKLQRALNTLLVSLRKHIATLEKLPHTIFQTLCNEGGPELSSQALNLLETRYSEIAYVEYLHKENVQRFIQAKFRCSGAVACFDVSPQLDYIVCECMDNTIQLWSLHTGKQLWKRDVKVTKDYYCELDEEYDGVVYEPYRPTKSFDYGMHYGWEEDDPSFPLKSLYRSVVFHPTQDLVLPGILSHAYSFHGELRPLFLSSKCRFSVCSISADKTKMLTDCTSDAKSIIMWSLTDGSEINRFAWNDDIVSFALSRDGRLLAVSDFRGSIGLRDVMDDYRTLAQTTISGVWGVIKFSPDCQCLYCFNSASWDLFRLDVNVGDDGGLSLDVSHNEVSYHPWEFESGSEPGFLLGDPFYLPAKTDVIDLWNPGLAFVLNKQSVLRVSSGGSIIEMLQPDELTEDSARDSEAFVRNVVFSLNGDRLFIITDPKGELMVWDISSGMLKAGKILPRGVHHNANLVVVREGLLLQTSNGTLELWDFELRECIRSWNALGYICEVMSISEDQVACSVLKKPILLDTARTEVKKQVIIVDTAKKGVVATIAIHGDFVACSSKCHVITTDGQELQMQCGAVVFWKIALPFKHFGFYHFKSFSPTEQYMILGDSNEIYVLDVALGRTLGTLEPRMRECYLLRTDNFKFFSDEECVACLCVDYSLYCLQLFNVKSGDLLSEIALENHVYSLAACPRERLVAISFMDSKVNFKVLQVKLPGDQHRSRSKRIKPKE
ncbi:uncharacterized protein [Acropora muricata]|uniref:uncharacterized protein isoform X3 n=1 Tax=Acropora muricata TaxID=159855 RepID=UPI0034E40CB2